MYNASSGRYERMSYAPCGKSGLKLPRVALGLWQNFGTQQNIETMRQMLHTAFDGGVTYFDMANNYGPDPGSAEENFGRLLREDFLPYRDELVLATKAGYTMWPGPYGDCGSRKHLMASLDQSLQRTGLSYFDIFYHHRMDPQTPLEETMNALADIVRAGKALYVGLSNYDGETARRATAILKELRCPCIVHQNRYSILDRSMVQNGLRDAAMECGQGIVAFSPLAQGLLTDKYLNGVPRNSRMQQNEMRPNAYLQKALLTPAMQKKQQGLNAIAAARGQSLAQLALSWVLADSAVVSVLIGASRHEQITENLAVINAAPLTAAELAEIAALCAQA